MKSLISKNRAAATLVTLLTAAALTACGSVTVSDEVFGCEPGEKELTFGFFSTHAMPDLTLSPTEYEGLDFLMEIGARGTSPDYSGIKLAGVDEGHASEGEVYRQMKETTYNEGVLCLDPTQAVALFVRGIVTLPLSFVDDQPMLTYDRFECDLNERGEDLPDGTTGETRNVVTAHRDLGAEDYINQNFIRDGLIRLGVQCNYTYVPDGWTGPQVRSYGSLFEETGGMVT